MRVTDVRESEQEMRGAGKSDGEERGRRMMLQLTWTGAK